MLGGGDSVRFCCFSPELLFLQLSSLFSGPGGLLASSIREVER